MSQAPDVRALRTYDQSTDPKFIYDCVYRRILDDTTGCMSPVNRFVRSLSEDLRTKCRFPCDVAAAAASEGFSGFAHYKQALSLAQLCGCERDLNRSSDGIYSTHESLDYVTMEELNSSLASHFADEFGKIEKIREKLGTDTSKNIRYAAFSFVLDKDSAGLKEFLDQLPLKSTRRCGGVGNINGANCKCSVCKPSWEMPTLEDVLLSKDKYGWTPLRWAAEVGSAGCISILLDASKKWPEAQNLFVEVLHSVEGYGAPAVFLSVYRADVECILAFLNAGADFTTACGGAGVSILEYLVHLASASGIGATYFPILETVLNYIKEKTPDLDLTAPIYYEKDNTSDGEEEDDIMSEEAEEVLETGEQEEGEDDEETDDGDEPISSFQDLFYDPHRIASRRYRSSRRHTRRLVPGYDYEDDDAPYDIYIPGFVEYCVQRSSDEKMVLGWAPKQRQDMYIPRYTLKSEENWEGSSWTLLSIAVEAVAVEVVKLLLEAGADPNYRVVPRSRNQGSNEGEGGGASTSREAGRGHGECPGLLSSTLMSRYGMNWSIVECQATIKLLLDAGADINEVRPRTKETALHIAAGKDQPAIVVFLIQNGADQRLKNAKGMTAAQEMERRNPELAELLTRELRLKRLMDEVDAAAAAAAARTDQRRNFEHNTGGDDYATDTQEEELNNNNTDSENSDDVNDEVPEDRQCGICWENERCVTLAPCGHRRLCKVCALKVLSCVERDRKCPFCKSSIESYVLQIYD